jgi:protocatechuate 3,4-dioxygenase beta subunit
MNSHAFRMIDLTLPASQEHRVNQPPAPADLGEEHDDHGGLHRDIPNLVGRRDILRMMGGVSLVGLLAACGVTGGEESAATTSSSAPRPTNSSADGASTSSTTAPGTGSSSTAPATSSPALVASPGAEIPDETPGPFPADGSNGPNLLDDEGVVRSDITASIGGSSGVAEGVPISFELSVVDAATGNPIPGAVVYLWHCTADGRYSIYEIEDENYLRGVQVANDAGRITYNSVFPGCYPGRWPHAHFEVYGSLEDAAGGSDGIKTSQLALPRADCEVVYGDARYGDSAASLSRLSLESDGVFADGWTDQLATVSGSPDAGYTASLLVRV